MSDSSTTFARRLLGGDRIIWAIVIILSVVSALVAYSATSQFVNKTGNVYHEIIQHGGTLVIGLLIAIAIHHNLSLKLIKKGMFILFGFSFCLIFATTFPGIVPSSLSGIVDVSTVNSASRWIEIFGVSFQPSEIAKLSLIGCIVYFLTVPAKDDFIIKFICKLCKRSIDDENFVKYTRLGLFLASTAVIDLPIMSANMSTGAIVAVICVSILWLSKVWDKAALVLTIIMIVVACLLFGVLIHGHNTGHHIFSRGETWYNRTISFALEDEETKYKYTDYSSQVIHSQIAIARGGNRGVGLGCSVERDYLPQIYADFVFAIIVEEYGLVLSVIFLLGYLALLYRCGIIAKRADDPYISLLTIGLGTIIVIQALISAGVAVHLGPVTGQPLPLISRGKTSLIITLLEIGLIERMAVLSKIKKPQVQTEAASATENTMESTDMANEEDMNVETEQLDEQGTYDEDGVEARNEEETYNGYHEERE